MRQTNQMPFCADFFEAAQQELAEALNDLPSERDISTNWSSK